MAENLTSVIREKVGLEYKEVFTLKGYDEERFMFDNTSLLRYESDSKFWVMAPCEVLAGIIYNKYQIVKLPFDPAFGDKYYTYSGWGFNVYQEVFTNLAANYAHKALGIAFRTEVEAIAARPAKFKELTGRDYVE